MYISEDTIAEAVSELFRYKVPKRLAEYWNDRYAGIASPSYIKKWTELSEILKSEYEAYSIGIRDNEEWHEIICGQCTAINKYTTKTGYKLELLPYETCHNCQTR